MLKKKCKVVMLSTNEKANIGAENWYLKPTNKLIINNLISHLYILSDDEIKEGDWAFESCEDMGIKHIPFKVNKNTLRYANQESKKIIATTDKLEIDNNFSYSNLLPNEKDFRFYLPQPSQSFIEKYLEYWNNSPTGSIITEVMIEYRTLLQKGEIMDSSYPKGFDEPILKVDKDNTITITKVKDSWSREEVEELCGKAFVDGRECSTEKYLNKYNWIKENL